MRSTIKEREVEITFLCDVGMQETVCFKLGKPKLKWYMLYDGRMVYSVG